MVKKYSTQDIVTKICMAGFIKSKQVYINLSIILTSLNAISSLHAEYQLVAEY